jgi:hypothetical protein
MTSERSYRDTPNEKAFALGQHTQAEYSTKHDMNFVEVHVNFVPIAIASAAAMTQMKLSDNALLVDG